MACLLFEKCEEEVLREVFQKKMVEKGRRYRSKMVKILDNYYFKELEKSELDR